MAKIRLSISLIRENIDSSIIIKNDVNSVQLINGQTLYYKSKPATSPKWLTSFFKDGIENVAPFNTKNISAAILYEIEIRPDCKRIFAITFGYGRNLLNNGVIEDRFGLITTLNAINPKQLRSVDVNRIESVSLNNRIQSSTLAGIGNFDIDINKDILKSVTGKSSLQGFDGSLSGADSLTISTDKDYETVKELLKDCYLKFESANYKTYFDWVDQIKTIKDVNLINTLNSQMIQEFNNENPSKVWISIPEILDWNRTDFFKVDSTTTLYDDIDIKKVKSELNNSITMVSLKNKKLAAVDENGTVYKHWSLYKCIYADISLNEKQYLLNEGIWYEVAEHFVNQVNNFYNSSTVSSIELPDYSEREEEMYNKLVEQFNNTEYCLMDRKTITIGGTPIEFCDIYSNHKQFVHVKRYSSSAVLSHLFFQGFVSAEAFMDKQFRVDINKKLKKGFSVPINDKITTKDYEVVFVIARENAKLHQRPDMPFFSKVAFRNVANRLQRYGYKVSITGVPYTYMAPQN